MTFPFFYMPLYYGIYLLEKNNIILLYFFQQFNYSSFVIHTSSPFTNIYLCDNLLGFPIRDSKASVVQILRPK